MRAFILGIFSSLLLSGCFTSESQRESLKTGSTDDISMSPPPSTPPEVDAAGAKTVQELVVILDGAKSRRQPNINAPVVQTFEKWSPVRVKATRNGWSQLEDSSWIESNTLGE